MFCEYNHNNLITTLQQKFTFVGGKGLRGLACICALDERQGVEVGIWNINIIIN